MTSKVILLINQESVHYPKEVLNSFIYCDVQQNFIAIRAYHFRAAREPLPSDVWVHYPHKSQNRRFSRSEPHLDS